jgi:hypothetical protein
MHIAPVTCRSPPAPAPDPPTTRHRPGANAARPPEAPFPPPPGARQSAGACRTRSSRKAGPGAVPANRSPSPAGRPRNTCRRASTAREDAGIARGAAPTAIRIPSSDVRRETV